MDQLALSGLAIPAIAACMAAIFAGFWHYNREDKAALWFAIAFACCALGYGISNYFVPKETLANAILNNAVYGIGIVFISFGACRAFNRKPPVLILGALAILGVAIAIAIELSEFSLGMRIQSVNTVHGLMFTVTLFRLRSIWNEHWTGAAVIVAFTLITLNYWLIAPLTTFNAGITEANFFESLYWRSMNVITVLSVLAAAGALISVCVVRNIRLSQDQIHRDWLTGLLTRRDFEQTAQKFCTQRSSEVAASLMLIEIDKFRSTTNVYGQRAADELIAAIGEVLNGRTRYADLVGRSGGGLFHLLLPGTDTAGARRLAARLKSCFRELSVPSLPLSHFVKASFGIAEFGEGSTYEDVHEQAEAARQRASAEGGNRIAYASRPAGAGQPLRREDYSQRPDRKSA